MVDDIERHWKKECCRYYLYALLERLIGDVVGVQKAGKYKELLPQPNKVDRWKRRSK